MPKILTVAEKGISLALAYLYPGRFVDQWKDKKPLTSSK